MSSQWKEFYQNARSIKVLLQIVRNYEYSVLKFKLCASEVDVIGHLGRCTSIRLTRGLFTDRRMLADPRFEDPRGDDPHIIDDWICTWTIYIVYDTR